MEFFQELRKGASDAAFEAQRLVRQQRQQLSIARLRRERDAAALALGNGAAEKAREGDLGDAQLSALAVSVLDIEDRVKLAEAELERIRGEQPPPVGQQEARPEPGLVCFNCGSRVPEGSEFCTQCGMQIQAPGERPAQPSAQAPSTPPPPPSVESPGALDPDVAGAIPPHDAPPMPFETQRLRDEDLLREQSTAIPPEDPFPGTTPAPPVPPPTAAQEQPPIVTPEESAQPEARTCAVCGTSIREGASFCINCGTRVG